MLGMDRGTERIDDGVASATVAAAIEAGITTLDTARAYAPTEDTLGHNERLVASVLASRGTTGVRVLTCLIRAHPRNPRGSP